MSNKTVAEEWREALRNTGYEHGSINCGELKKFSRVWKRVLSATDLVEKAGTGDLKIFEAGCGGGKHLAPFALRGVECIGLDFSPEVLERAKKFVEEVRRNCGAELNVKFICSDFLQYRPQQEGNNDLVFHVGVIEHFLDDTERLTFLKNMFNLARPGGYVVSIVPSGTHPLRQKMKTLKLGGYGIPEVDYNPQNMLEEFLRCGGTDIKILPHNIFGYLLIDNSYGIKKILQKLFFYFFQIVPPNVLSRSFAVRHAGTLIGMARKPKF